MMEFIRRTFCVCVCSCEHFSSDDIVDESLNDETHTSFPPIVRQEMAANDDDYIVQINDAIKKCCYLMACYQ